MPVRVDDPTISHDAVLWRRIIPQWLHEDNDGTIRPASIAFKDRLSGELSVHIASLTDVDRALKDRPGDSLTAFPAGLPRSFGYAIVREPTDDDPSHALICPSPRDSDARKLAKQSSWVVLNRNAV